MVIKCVIGTKNFLKATQQNNQNKINSILNISGDLTYKKEDIHDTFVNYFKEFFKRKENRKAFPYLHIHIHIFWGLLYYPCFAKHQRPLS